MKKLILIFGFLSAGFSNAQTTTAENYISTTNCLNEDCTKKIETVQYLDLLGRAKQVVNVKATPLGKDIVTPIVYDDQGRQTRNYLPVPQNSTSNGAIYSQTSGMTPYPIADVTNIYSGEKTYTETILENSPLQRVLEQKHIGNDWNIKPVKFEYDVATVGDSIKRFSTATTWENGATKSIPSNAGIYQNGQLYKSTVKDEDGSITIQFKNGRGQLILVRKVMSSTVNADTYYIYNEYNQLAFVVPPLLAKIKSWSQADQDNLAYEYRYDTRGRQVEKKLPGKGWQYIVYDKQDRIIAAQDVNLREKGQWGYTKYDQFGRVAITGISTGAERWQEQDIANSYDTNNVNRLSSVLFERQGMEVYYGNPDATYPNSTKWVSLLSLNYYDSYPTYSFNPPFPSSVQGEMVLKETPSEGKSTQGLPVMSLVKNIEDDNWTKNYIYYDRKGRAIGSHTINHLGGYTKTESALDFAGAAKQTKAYHKRLATDPEKVITQTFTYDEQNRLLVHKHQIDNNPEEILVQNQYNELSQLKIKKLGGTNIAQPLQSIDYNYNIRGWLTKINDPSNLNGRLFGYELKYSNPVNANVTPGRYTGIITEMDWKNASEDVLKRYNYTYDGLNRLKDAVYSEPNATTVFNNNYNEYLTYDLNGNIKTLKRNASPITGTTATQVDDLVYEYTGNRLMKVTENALNDTGYEGGNNAISYDLNGNMKDMLDKGIQSIAYNYLNLTNQVGIQHKDLFGQFSNSYISYLYRADGTKLRKTYSGAPPRGSVSTNMTDYLDGFQYSYFEGGGICLECRTKNAYEQQAYRGIIDPGFPSTPEWKLDFVATAVGFYSFKENRYIYQYKDHLGNTRVNFTKNSAGAPEITDTNNYYPFGLNHISGQFNTANFGSYNSYKYNGKELQETGMFDYGWRQYLPDLGRWNGMDQLSDAYASTSPFAYVANNPISMRDPDGRWMDANGHIDTSGNSNPFRDMARSRMLMNEFLGRQSGEGGGGAYTFSGNDARAIFNYLVNKEKFSGVSITDGKVTWYTGNATQTSYRMGNDFYGDIDLGEIHTANFKTSNFFDLSLLGKMNDGMGGFGEGLSYNGKNGIRLYVGTARPGNPVDLGFTKFYGNGKTYIKPAYMSKAGNILGKASIAGTVILGGVNIYNGYEKDGGKFGQNATVATGGTIGGALGAYQGAIWGAEIGAAFGALIGGVGAAPGALIGGIVGGIAGGMAGTKLGENVVN